MPATDTHTRKRSETRWRQALLPLDSKLQQAISNLDQVAIKIVMVVDAAGVLQGTLSDGDIRRGLLRGMTMDSPIRDIIKRNAWVVPRDFSRELVMQLMVANRIQQIPIVDEQHHVVGIHLWEEITTPEQRPNWMVIMAGGLGTRLRPHTETCPKPMLPVAGRPMLEHIIERARNEGFNQFVIATHYLGHMIEDYFGAGEKLNVNIRYLREDQPLGTAGALSLLQPSPALPIVVTNGDVMTDIHYAELLDFHNRYEATATMAVRVHEWQHPFGVVQTQGVDIIGLDEKPVARSHINAGVYALSPAALAALEANSRCDMPTLFERLRLQGCRTVAYPMHEPWLDVGRPDDLAAIRSQSTHKDHEK